MLLLLFDSELINKLFCGNVLLSLLHSLILFQANPPQYDRAEDLASVRYLNESSCLHTLRQRFGSNLIHTYAGPNLIVINPQQQLAIYTDKVSNE